MSIDSQDIRRRCINYKTTNHKAVCHAKCILQI